MMASPSCSRWARANSRCAPSPTVSGNLTADRCSVNARKVLELAGAKHYSGRARFADAAGPALSAGPVLSR